MGSGTLFSELARRNVIRVAGLYLVAAWLATQVAGTVLPMFDAPGWIARTAVILLAIGFLPAMGVAWAFELTPEGLKRDAKVAPEASIAPQTGRRLERLIIALLAIALAYFCVDKFVLAPRNEAPRKIGTLAQARPSAPAPAAAAAVPAKSIAVLPFENLSDNKDNVYFSDGLSEEILNSLARVDGLRVIGRTSSFQFKGKDVDSHTIGERLGVANLLEGSVQREGERARVTAQLIRASDGVQLWSQAYDRTVRDSLAVQLDIAEKVAGVLNVVLDDTQRARMRAAGVKNVDAFIAYQKGWKLYMDAHHGGDLLTGLRQANVEFDRAIALEPDFSFAYFAKADLYEHTLMADGRSQAELLEAQRAALQTLERAAATSPDPQQRELALAERQLLSDDWHDLAARIEAALKQPGCSAPNWMPVFASAFGYGDLIENLGARVNVCDPLNAVNYRTRISVALATGHPQRALDILAKVQKVLGSSPMPTTGEAVAQAMQGNIQEARTTLASLEPTGEYDYLARLVVGVAAGESAASIHARLRKVNRKSSKLKMWDIVDAVEASLSGDRAEANRRATALDARPAGGLLLAIVVTECHCGAPFDLAATPNFKARLAESGLRWPLPATIKYPTRAAQDGSLPVSAPIAATARTHD